MVALPGETPITVGLSLEHSGLTAKIENGA